MKPPQRTPAAPGAFTLVEILVSVGIVAVLIALTIPALRGARESARRASCMSNLRTFGQAIEAYRADHGGRLPPAVWPIDLLAGRDQPLRALLPYTDAPLPDTAAILEGRPVEPYRCPSDADWNGRTGCSYIYTPWDLMAASTHHDPQMDVTRFLERDSTVVIMHDAGWWHPGAEPGVPMAGRNVLRLDGGVEAGSGGRKTGPR